MPGPNQRARWRSECDALSVSSRCWAALRRTGLFRPRDTSLSAGFHQLCADLKSVQRWWQLCGRVVLGASGHRKMRTGIAMPAGSGVEGHAQIEATAHNFGFDVLTQSSWGKVAMYP